MKGYGFLVFEEIKDLLTKVSAESPETKLELQRMRLENAGVITNPEQLKKIVLSIIDLKALRRITSNSNELIIKEYERFGISINDFYKEFKNKKCYQRDEIAEAEKRIEWEVVPDRKYQELIITNKKIKQEYTKLKREYTKLKQEICLESDKKTNNSETTDLKKIPIKSNERPYLESFILTMKRLNGNDETLSPYLYEEFRKELVCKYGCVGSIPSAEKIRLWVDNLKETRHEMRFKVSESWIYKRLSICKLLKNKK